MIPGICKFGMQGYGILVVYILRGPTNGPVNLKETEL